MVTHVSEETWEVQSCNTPIAEVSMLASDVLECSSPTLLWLMAPEALVNINFRKGENEMKVDTIGIDLAKRVFQVHGVDQLILWARIYRESRSAMA